MTLYLMKVKGGELLAKSVRRDVDVLHITDMNQQPFCAVLLIKVLMMALLIVVLPALFFVWLMLVLIVSESSLFIRL